MPTFHCYTAHSALFSHEIDENAKKTARKPERDVERDGMLRGSCFFHVLLVSGEKEKL